MNTYLLVGDIGGTYARFALARDGMLENVESLTTVSHSTLDAAIRSYLKDKPAIAAASLAVAAPAIGDIFSFTNNPWEFSQKDLEGALGCDVEVVNDFAAVARGIPFLSGKDCIPVPGPRASTNHDRPGPIAVIGPGTGLGVATLIRANDTWIDLAGEGGHVTMVAATPEEDRVLTYLHDRWEHVSAERVLSGAGLVALYDACCELRQVRPARLTAEQITAAAISPEQDHCGWLCAHAFGVFCAMLGTIAANLALTVGAIGGVYIAGGILRQYPDFFRGSRFRYRFEQKGRLSGYLRAIPTFLVMNETPAMIGLARWRHFHSKVKPAGWTTLAPTPGCGRA